MLPISLMQQFSVWTVSCWPRTWLGRGSIVNKLQTLKVSPTSHCHMGHPATGGGGILQFEVLLEIPAFPAGVWMECVAPTAWAVPGRAERMSCTVLSLSLVCLTLLCTAPGRCWCSLAGEARWGLPGPPGCFACLSGSVLPSGAARGWNLAAPSVPSPRAGLDGCLQEDSGLWEGDGWRRLLWLLEEGWLPHLGLLCLPCRARGALAAPGSAGEARMREWRYFKLLNGKANCHCSMGC